MNTHGQQQQQQEQLSFPILFRFGLVPACGWLAVLVWAPDRLGSTWLGGEGLGWPGRSSGGWLFLSMYVACGMGVC
jgi:hypothetical protein